MLKLVTGRELDYGFALVSKGIFSASRMLEVSNNMSLGKESVPAAQRFNITI